MISAQAAADKWAANLAGATQAIKDGVQAVTVSPTQQAAGRLDAYLAGVTAAVNSGRMAAALNAVSLPQWQNAMITKGINIIAQRAQQAKPKMLAFMQKWLAHEAQIPGILATMPRGNLQQNISRAVAVISHNANFKGQGKS